MPVIDASVYVAMMNAGEANHAASWSWFERVIGAAETVHAPAILVPEVASALRRGVDDPELARSVVQQLTQLHTITLVPVTEALAERAAHIALEHRVRGCDAVYLALAAETGGPLVTLDRQQLERGASVVPTTRPN